MLTTIALIAAGTLAALALGALLLPRTVTVTRSGHVSLSPAEVIAMASSSDGYQRFNPYCSTDPNLKITPFGPAAGVGSGFAFEGKEGKGTQTVTDVTRSEVHYLIDLGAMGKPRQVIRATASGTGSEITWTVTSDLGMNPIFRIFGLFMDGMLGKVYERGLRNMAAA
ncbi:MAG: SRPBCC family protein [Pseudomonadota bacterium]